MAVGTLALVVGLYNLVGEVVVVWANLERSQIWYCT